MSWTRRAGALAGALVLGVSLVACGAAPSSPDIAGLVEGCVGSWELESAEFDEGDVDAETLEEMESYGMRVTLDLDSDGDLLIDAFGQQQTGTWELRDADTLTLTLEGEGVDAPLADGRLTLAYDGETLVFTKTSDEPVMDRDPSDNAGDLGMGGLDDLEETVDDVGHDGPEPTEFSDLFSDELVVWQLLYTSSVEVDVPLDVVAGDDETALVKITGIGTDPVGDTGYLVSVENRTDVDFVLTNARTTVDGADVWEDATLYCMAAAGETSEGFLFVDRGVATVTEGTSCEITLAAVDHDENVLATYEVAL
ncbi:hypothetical protein INF26_05860 [Olsenella sp. DSM 107455]|uniref:Lipocalin-like domain-containing protein n=1 Tax=Thermophilibacter gallinarum TaxID=2779357 RepID=A0ABR9QTI8_9ACTN|nr:hypothetical protein [Thermophilibacter gallinarum]MBE5024380.1 hypothetical protein [Thermophilibacter gallinarum]